MPPPRYPSDLSDEEWAILEPLLASAEKRGRPPKWPLRQVADAVFYLLRSGCSWRMLPREYPPWQTVYNHFRKWRIDGRLHTEPTTVFARRCARRRGASRTLAQR
jgi:putative transposase